MTSVEKISLADLATVLGTEPDRLAPLVVNGFLNVVVSGCTMETVIVERPSVKTLSWLRRFMLVPLNRRPLLPFRDVASVLKTSTPKLREYCEELSILIYADSTFGCLISIDDFYVLQKHLYEKSQAIRTDHGAMLHFLMSLRAANKPAIASAKLLKFSERLNREIQRIAALPEPIRTLRATDLWTAYRESNTVAECLGKLSPAKYKIAAKNRLDNRMRDVQAVIEGADVTAGTFFVPGIGDVSRAVQSRAASVAMTEYWKQWRARKSAALLAEGKPCEVKPRKYVYKPRKRKPTT